MPRFFFHLFDGSEVVSDPEGMELAGLCEAKTEARADCRGFAVEELRSGRPFPIWSAVEICDGDGRVVHREWCRSLIPMTPIDHLRDPVAAEDAQRQAARGSRPEAGS